MIKAALWTAFTAGVVILVVKGVEAATAAFGTIAGAM